MKMIKRFWKRIKASWNKFKIYLIGEPPTNQEIFEAIFDYVLNNKPHVMSVHCHCGSVLSIYDIEKHFNNNYVHVLYHCKKCNCTTEKRFTYNMEEIKN